YQKLCLQLSAAALLEVCVRFPQSAVRAKLPVIRMCGSCRAQLAVLHQGDVYLYTNLKRAMCFVIGTEDMSFARYLFMGLCPNLVFGIFPFVIYLFFPHLAGVGIFGALCICIGFMDYVNIFKAMFQIPKDALVFMSGLRTYWYRKGSS
ncbi:MAG: DUF3267 domain-containing protein, partial [Bulleidia sp.]|nr:DUF3267 domain-containing protein [Bulleidia sp.]